MISVMFFVAAAVVLVILLAGYRPDNSPRAKIERTLAAVSGFIADSRAEDPYTAQVIALDTNARLMALCTLGRKARVIAFGDLIAAEIERDGVTVETTNRGSQVVGGAIGAALLGPAGLIVGGLSGKKTHTQTVNRLTLKLIVSDLEHPTIDLVFHDVKGTEQLTPIKPYSAPAEQRLMEWYARFQVIIHQNQQVSAPPKPDSGDFAPAPDTKVGFGRRRSLVAGQ
jgi:hypothetical protein